MIIYSRLELGGVCSDKKRGAEAPRWWLDTAASPEGKSGQQAQYRPAQTATA